MNNKYLLKFDWYTVLVYCALVSIGLTNIYSTGHSQGENMFSLGHTFGKQLLFSALGILVIFFVQFPRVKVYERYSSIFYLIVLVLLVGLFVFGNEVSGAKSWYSVAGFSFQPAELAKVVTALALTKHLSEINTDLRNISHQISAFILILIPAFLILPQPDPGSTVVFLSFLLVLHTEKLPSRYILVFCGVVILFIITLLIGHNLTTYVVITIAVIYIIGMKNKKRRKVFLPTILVVLLASGFIQSVDYVFENVFEQRHRDRFNIVLGREVDTQGIGYNINQSQIAIGSGGMFGKGFLEGTQTKGNFVPEQQTDYIFTTVGEEWGFVGTFFVIVLFMVLMLRILFTSKRQKNKFSRIYCYSVVSLIFAHFSINLGMVLGLLPTIGIPLPFLSYGGSNLLAFSLLLGIYLKLDANRVNEW
ncbi:MAG: rod shape-determining protein RodA [Flavobacteriaceae bacterium]|nr:rod shape-determining protein RodA [Flavobacteriaceae bacterium]